MVEIRTISATLAMRFNEAGARMLRKCASRSLTRRYYRLFNEAGARMLRKCSENIRHFKLPGRSPLQ